MQEYRHTAIYLQICIVLLIEVSQKIEFAANKYNIVIATGTRSAAANSRNSAASRVGVLPISSTSYCTQEASRFITGSCSAVR